MWLESYLTIKNKYKEAAVHNLTGNSLRGHSPFNEEKF